MTELPVELAHNLHVLRELKSKIAELQAHVDDLTAELRGQLACDEYSYDGAPAVTVHETKRFSPEAAKNLLPPEVAERCTETLITSAKAKSQLPPDVYAACQQPVGKRTVRIH